MKKKIALLLFSAILINVSGASAANVGVLLRFGFTDKEAKNWDGQVAVTSGRVAEISGWRFADFDKVLGTSGWKAATAARKNITIRSNNPEKAKEIFPEQDFFVVNDKGVFLNLADTTEQTEVTVSAPQGKFSFKLSEIPYGTVLQKLDGAVKLLRTAYTNQLTESPTDDDFPALTIGSDGTSYLVYTSFTPGIDRDLRINMAFKPAETLPLLADMAGGDQLWLRTLKQNSTLWSEPIAITPARLDIYKSAVSVDGDGRTWIFWSQNKNWPAGNYPKALDGKFEIWARSYKDGKFSKPEKISAGEENNHSPVTVTDSNGHVWVAWMGARKDVFKILSRHQEKDGTWSEEIEVSQQKRNCWYPAIAADNAHNRIAIAWDTYEKGDYDVWLREFDTKNANNASKAKPAANTNLYEARPTLTYDLEGNLWIAWEEAGPTWGKDWGYIPNLETKKKGIPLGRERQIGLRILTPKGKWLETIGKFSEALPFTLGEASLMANDSDEPLPPPQTDPNGETNVLAAKSKKRTPYNNISRLASDNQGRVWLFVRTRVFSRGHPFDLTNFTLGSAWVEYAAQYNGETWVGPILIPHTDNLLYNLPAISPAPEGGLLIAHSSDHRLNRHWNLIKVADYPHPTLEHDVFDNDIYVSRLGPAPVKKKSVFKNADKPPKVSPTSTTLKELEAVARCRKQQISVRGSKLRLLRGEFHRHTEMSRDGEVDGPLEDMWRYALDVAAMDFIGNGDHDNGYREYPWWLTQKTTDAYQLPGYFDPLFSHERSQSFPEGHRNVVFPNRGLRSLPRIRNEKEPGTRSDTQLLYSYLKKFGGICAAHTSGTRSMGTDWGSKVDAEVEPFVEIYQGLRQNYERPGAPRSPTENQTVGGWNPDGFVNVALKKGARLGFQASSDHQSTHISYTMVYAESATRKKIFEAIKARHIYGATDNIVADFRSSDGSKEYMMGEEFATEKPPVFQIKLHGTAPFARVVLVKDDVETVIATPNKSEVELSWTDPNPTAGQTSYYYIRGEQVPDKGSNYGELVWVSPIWVKYK
jgi:hypothetical protein